MTEITAALRQLDRQHVWHPFTPMRQWIEGEALIIAAADGMHLIDSDGNRYLDGVSSLWCNVHGHRVPEIDDAVRAQLDKVAHTTMLGLCPANRRFFAERLMQIVPPGPDQNFLQRQRRDCDGSRLQDGGPILVQHRQARKE